MLMRNLHMLNFLDQHLCYLVPPLYIIWVFAMIEQGNKVIGEVYKAGDYEPGSKTMIIPSKKEGEANAALIASAPELLEACKHAISHTNDVNWQMIVNAIAKAEAR